MPDLFWEIFLWSFQARWAWYPEKLLASLRLHESSWSWVLLFCPYWPQGRVLFQVYYGSIVTPGNGSSYFLSVMVVLWRTSFFISFIHLFMYSCMRASSRHFEYSLYVWHWARCCDNVVSEELRVWLYFVDFCCCWCLVFMSLEHRIASHFFQQIPLHHRVFVKVGSWPRGLTGCPPDELSILGCVHFWSLHLASPVSRDPALASRSSWGDCHPAFTVLCPAAGVTLCPVCDIPGATRYLGHCCLQGPSV